MGCRGPLLAAAAAAAAAFLAPLATEAVYVTTNSPCSRYCGNVLSSTSGDDLTCSQSGYGSSTGQVFEACVNCELASTYSAGNFTDTGALLYNLRAGLSWCVFGFPDNPSAGSNPCTTSFACGPLRDAIEFNRTTNDAYEYCDAWAEDRVASCSSCLAQLSDGQYLQNFLTVLDAGCQQEPATGVTVAIQGDIFSNQAVIVGSPADTVSTTDYGSVSLGARVGIAFGALAFVLIAAGACIICNGRRRRRRFLRELQKRHGHGWPSIGHQADAAGGGADAFETPMSQKPLRGWENESPISAHTGTTADARHFTPYSSQVNSPVSAAEGPVSAAEGPVGGANGTVWPFPPPPAFAQWPSPVQEKPATTQWDQEGAAAAAAASQHRETSVSPVSAVGLAVGGSEPSVRSKVSDMSIGSGAAAGGSRNSPSGGSRGKQPQSEAYEMHEVQDASWGAQRDSSYTNAAAAQAPVLSHPGYGRRNRSGSLRRGREGFI